MHPGARRQRPLPRACLHPPGGARTRHGGSSRGGRRLPQSGKRMLIVSTAGFVVNRCRHRYKYTARGARNVLQGAPAPSRGTSSGRWLQEAAPSGIVSGRGDECAANVARVEPRDRMLGSVRFCGTVVSCTNFVMYLMPCLVRVLCLVTREAATGSDVHVASRPRRRNSAMADVRAPRHRQVARHVKKFGFPNSAQDTVAMVAMAMGTHGGVLSFSRRAQQGSELRINFPLAAFVGSLSRHPGYRTVARPDCG